MHDFAISWFPMGLFESVNIPALAPISIGLRGVIESSETKHHSFPPSEVVSITSRASQCRQNQISTTFTDTFEVYFVKCFDLRAANSIRFIVIFVLGPISERSWNGAGVP